ncbi:ABC transporter permease [Paenibacillus polymyxa]|uniref:ABC transporter permease n=1 Tax=Paenibacillus polymyxa TaxID=1406 RepID=UPI0020251BFC|nr:ABC transporter permease [Paenibacillus polymyxa]URJ40136.3 ABC transporter permease [Paenibacillus polymyxa]
MKTEIIKLKRYSIIWIGIAAMLLVVLLSRYMETAADGTLPTFESFSNSVIWNNFSLFFPATITLMSGYIITRERVNDTLKNILTVPVSFRSLLIGKLITVGLIAIFLGVVSFGLTLFIFLLSHYPGLAAKVLVQSFFQMIGINVCVYLAVLPIIILTSHSANGFMAGVGFAFFYGIVGAFASGHDLTSVYPITAGLGIINYQGEEGSSYNLSLCYLTLIAICLISIVLIAVMGKKSKTPAPLTDKFSNKSLRKH